jgi:ATP-binding cassette, subfamily C (CFTR/MRP), member 4
LSQQPAVFSDTIRNNILYGRSFNKNAYEKAIKMCCLSLDIKNLPNGDMTAIGEKGATLSTGQKVRVVLARVIYTEADIYLLDEPLASLDSKVAKKVFERCMKKLGKEKTVIMVTQNHSYIT